MIFKHTSGGDVQRLRLQNSKSEALILFVEPWGEQLRVPAHATYEIVAQGPAGGCPEIEIGDDRVAVYGWPGSIVSVFDHNRLICECRIPVPETPPRTETP